ncbi:GDSL esterase/lipase [Glycine max]|nr:GDSL esterase/lipase [Glycine max]
MKIFILFSITFAYGFLGSVVSNANPLPYEVIFDFGDSIWDTGNAAKYHQQMPNNSPYGSTYFKHPCGIHVPEVAYSLSTQLDWFKKLKRSLCKSVEECDRYFKNSLFLVGEMGENDIKRAIKLVVPGNFPIGCNSAALVIVNSDKKDDYDQFGCLTAYNAFIKYYNKQLKKAIETLRHENPNVKITYFDYYGATTHLFQASQQYGFSSNKIETFRACCGKGEPYNLSLQIACGSLAAMVCPNPSKHLNWDGPHFPEATYRPIAKGLLEGPFANPPLKIA